MKARVPSTNRNDMMKKLQDMQDEMARVQEELEEREYNASSGGGAVEATVNGRHELKAIKMKPEIVDPEDIDMLEDLILAAVNEAVRRAGDNMEEEMAKVAGPMQGMNIPGMGF